MRQDSGRRFPNRIYWLPQFRGRMKRNLRVGGAFLAVLLVLGAGSSVLHKRAVVHAAGGTQAPRLPSDRSDGVLDFV